MAAFWMRGLWIRWRHNWFRSLLAMGQVAIAITAVTVVLADVLPNLRPQALEESGSVFIAHYGVERPNSVMFTSIFLPEDVAYLAEHAETIEAASLYERLRNPVIRVGDERYALRGGARVHPGFERLAGLRLVAGSFFTGADLEAPSPRVALISEELARLLFGKVEVVGERINLRPEAEGMALQGFSAASTLGGPDLTAAMAAPGEDLSIIGVFAPPPDTPYVGYGFGGAADLLLPATAMTMPGPPAMAQSQSGQSGPLGGAQGSAPSSAWSSPAPQPRVLYASELLFRPRPGMQRQAEEEVRALLSGRLAGRPAAGRTMDGFTPDLFVREAFTGQSVRRARLQGALLTGAMGLAALVVSAITMFTTTLANLAQRTADIGLSRAVGATRGRVVREVVLEAALLAGLGGIAGVLLAFPLRRTLLAPLMGSGTGSGLTVGEVLLVGLAGTALAMAVGAVAALYPAWTVARLVPAEAWREGRA